jgi:hypothetical protein
VETFHVYVTGAEDRSNAGLATVAEAIAEHYGLPMDDLLGRLTRGRFRVKSGCDRATADQYRRDLVKLGARVVIEAASPTDRPSGASLPPPSRPTPPPMQAAGTPPPSPSPVTPALGAPRVGTTTPPAGVQSGLAAAYSGQNAAADLSAFDKLDGASLAALDGSDGGAPPAAAAFKPPAATAGAPGKPGAAAKPARPKDVPLDMDFRPPDAEEAEMKMEIAADEIEHRARKRAPAVPAANTTATPSAGVPTAPPSQPVPPPAAKPADPASQSVPSLTPPAAKSRPSTPVLAVAPRSRLGPLADERVRMAAGVVVAILLGFVPAHLIASAWERSAYRTIDAKVDHDYQEAEESTDAYALLDTVRDHELDAKRSTRTNIVVVCLLVWAAAGVGVGYVWFKRVPWDDLA